MEQTFTQKVEETIQKKLDEITERLRHQYQTFSSGGGGSTTSSHGGSNSQIQNHQPFVSHSNNRYQYQHPNYQNNWGFYEHPITQKRVRDSNFGYEPPTRDLPLISLVANAPETASRSSDVKGGGSISSLTTSATGPSADLDVTRERGHLTSKYLNESQKRFESLDATLQFLKENVCCSFI